MKKSIFKAFAALCMMAAPFVATAQTISIPDIEGEPGSEVILPISINNGDEAFVAFQLDMLLPEGVELMKDSYGDYEIELTDRAARTHMVSANITSNGAVRIVVYSTKNHTFTGSEGSVVDCKIKLPDVAGTYDVEVFDALVTYSDLSEHAYPNTSAKITVKGSDSITDIISDDSYSECYDIHGRRVSNTSKGLLIKNGKKVYVNE